MTLQKRPWKPGETIVLRGVDSGRLWWAMPVTVVRDAPDLVALYWRAGTRGKNSYKRPDVRDLLSREQMTLVDYVWVETDVLMLAVPGEAHSVWVMWEAGTSRQRCWYVNLETPLQRTRLGFDVMDQTLDVVVLPDRSGWRWKDEADFEECVEAGVYSTGQARAIRSEGESVVRRMQANEPPFCDGWEKWTPPPGWASPELPQGWDDL